MNEIINIITLPHRTDRKQSFMEQMADQQAAYRVWNGIVDPVMPFRGISKAHKQIIQDAKDKGFKRVTVMEDDCVFSDKGAWDYYLSQIPESYDVFFGMVYQGDINPATNRIEFGYSGNTLYTVHERFYDAFLGMKEYNNLDREIGLHAYKYEYYVCSPFVCFQLDGFSDHKKESATYGHLIEGKKMFKANTTN